MELGSYPISEQQWLYGTTLRLSVAATEQELNDINVAMAAGTVSVHGRARYAAVTADGATRFVADDDIEIGAAGTTPTLNDRASFSLGAETRALLRGEGPEITITADPVAGSDIYAGWSITVSSSMPCR